MFYTDLDQSNKTVKFVHRYLRFLGFQSEIVDIKPSLGLPHPPDIVVHLQDQRLGLEIKEDVKSINTRNIYFERKALMKFAETCVTMDLVPFLCYIPYCCPQPNLLFLGDELRTELNTLYKENIVKKVYGGDDLSIGWTCPFDEFILLSSNISSVVFEPENQAIFEKWYKHEFFNESNHFYHRYL